MPKAIPEERFAFPIRSRKSSDQHRELWQTVRFLRTHARMRSTWSSRIDRVHIHDCDILIQFRIIYS
ncbi:UNVERIFIED_CONTAM: hypothetical protein NCL1_58145 [Trichonephila clavipes]